MSVYDLEFNKDDVLLRNVIIGVLSTLHNKLSWYNKTSNTQKTQIDIPFFFQTTGDERFLQDMFLQDIVYDPEKTIAETVYNKIPRAIVEMTGVEIDPAKLSNQSVRGTYNKEVEDGTTKSYNAEFIPIPLNITMDISIIVDTMLDQFKAVESIIRNIYKDSTFQINVGGIRIPGSFSVPEGTTMDRTIEFRSGTTDTKETKVVFSIDVIIEYPVFKNAENGFVGAADTEMFNGNRMVRISGFNQWGGQDSNGNSIIGSTGATSSSNLYIDPAGLSDTGYGPSLTAHQKSTNITIGTVPETRPWPYGDHKK